MAVTGITKWHGDRVFKLATKANVVAMEKAAALVENYVKTHFTLQGTGAASKRTKSGKKHRASAPGEPPAIDTGILRASMIHTVQKTALEVIGKVGTDIEHIAAKAPAGTDVNYGLYLELGTSKMAPRPYLRPALIATKKKVLNIFKKANGK